MLSVDQPYNQFPSLHVSLGIIAWQAIAARLHGWAKLLTGAWFLAILASTVLVYQHHIIDLFGGAAVAALVFHLVPVAGRCRIPLNFVSPRHLRVALRYLIAAAAAAVAAFSTLRTWPILSVLCAWTGCSLLLVAASYALGANGFLRKTRRGYSPLTWLLYWPYLLGSALSWRYWRRRVPLMAEIGPGVWIGARPCADDWHTVERRRIASVIDLAPELGPCAPASIAHSHLPLLDVAIPDPAALHRIVRAIDERVGTGGVLVHCALGMSRSVLAACAWLMHKGHTAHEAMAIVDGVRPARVTRSYMNIALDLYQEYLERRARAG